MKTINELTEEIVQLNNDIDAASNIIINNDNEFSIPSLTGPTPSGPVTQDQPRCFLCRVIHRVRGIFFPPALIPRNSEPTATAGLGVPLISIGPSGIGGECQKEF